ncbi:MAG TPA: hypothetical protein VJT50_04050 [Pyrinomonadaceae bacterium]|nr:hypothetical protein [Pyrinomonadaceae bacterium]
MKTHVGGKRTAIYGFVVILLAVAAVVATPLLSRAAKPQMTLTIVNNSSREIRHVYFSPTDQDNWGADQLNSSTIAPGGGTATISNSACSGAGTKAIAEDQNGCFVYRVFECDGNAEWTITNDVAPDCGN